MKVLEAVLGLRWRLYFWWRPPGVVLWGAREGIDRQLGDPLDRFIAKAEWRNALVLHHQRRMAASILRVSLTFQDRFTPAVRAARESLERFARAHDAQLGA